jgi:hypothetical protein
LHGRGLARKLVRDTKLPGVACGGAWLVWCGTPNRPFVNHPFVNRLNNW